MQSLATKPQPFLRNHFVRDAIGQALYDAMIVDASIVLLGEGAHIKQHYDMPTILRGFPDRIVTMPISEDGNTNFAVGMSLLGVKPVVDVIAGDFLYRTLDSIANTAAKLDFVSGREHTIIIRAEFLLGGPTTGQRPEAIFTHIPGLRVLLPSTPREAYGLMRDALVTPGVTLFFEDRMIKDDDDWDERDLKLEGCVPSDRCSWRMKGQRGNVTILTYGVMRQVVERALRSVPKPTSPYSDSGDISEEWGMQCDVIDLWSLYPINWGFINKMLERTGRLLIVEPDVTYGGIGAEIAATLAEMRPGVRIKRLGAPRTTVPASPAFHSQMMPTEEQIVSAIRKLNQ